MTDYAKATWVPSPNYSANRDGHNPTWTADDPNTWIVLHTMVGAESAARARFMNPAQQASSHYGVCLDGRVIQYVAEKDAAWTNGTYDVNPGSNLDSITIEHEDDGDFDGPRTIALYEASAELVADVSRRRKIPLAHRADGGGVLGHRECQGASTACPDALDVDWIINRAGAKLSGRTWTDTELLHLAAIYSWDEIKAALGVVLYARTYALAHPPAVPEAVTLPAPVPATPPPPPMTTVEPALPPPTVTPTPEPSPPAPPEDVWPWLRSLVAWLRKALGS